MIKETECRCVVRNGQQKSERNPLLEEKKIQIELENRNIEVICTDQFVDELIVGRIYVEHQEMQPLSSIIYKNSWVFSMADRMAEGMPLHEKTWGTHSAFLFRKGELLFACEDIGRHNAIDKVIGYALKNDITLTCCAIYSSGRAPSDMVEKIIRAGVPIFVTKGVPTNEAVELAAKYQLTLICGARRDEMRIYSDYRKKEVDVLILAGGKSTRMGGFHKGNLKIGEDTFIKHLVDEMRKVTEHILISYGTDIHEQPHDCRIVTDIYKDCGPMGGIHAGLTAADAEYVFVVACDMPFMEAEFVESLREHVTENTDVVVPLIDGKVQPLAAIYNRSILPVIEELLEKRRLKLRSIYEQVNTIYIEMKGTKMENMLRNINTMEEYKEI